MNDHYYAVIMAGGSGTRLWPLSRKERPKQMLSLVGDRTLFQSAIDRLNGLFDPERIFVVTIREQAEDLQSQCPEIPKSNYLLEPMPRGTASVVGLAAVALKNIDPDAIMAVLTADHIIKNTAVFHKLLVAARNAAWDDYLLTLGIKPAYPATGYGYIQQGSRIGSYGGLDINEVDLFVEKPTEMKAKQMLAAGGYAWNSGMFVWKVERILEEFARQMPELYTGLDIISQAWGEDDVLDVVAQVWSEIESETIDYGIMENAKKAAVIPAGDLGWNDVGSWDALFDILPSDANGNITLGEENVALETRDSLVFKEQGGHLVVTIGVNDLIIVTTDDVTLVCGREKAQDVRQVVNRLKKESREGYL